MLSTVLLFLKSKLGKQIAIVVAAVVALMSVLGLVHHDGFVKGKAVIQTAWNKDKEATKKVIDQLRGRVQQQEFAHRQESNETAQQLRKAENQYEKTLADLRTERSMRVQLSRERAKVYQRLSQGGAADQRSLAGYTTGLDRSLEEGRGLVKELRSTIEFREDQLRLLGSQISSDRKLLDETK